MFCNEYGANISDFKMSKSEAISVPPKRKLRELFFGGRKDVDMTEGGILRHLITFAIPLLIGNIFQQLYNTVDTWVVGNYVSNVAFGAVGTVGPIINTLIGFFSGLASGAGAVISQYYGAKKYDKVSEAVHTSVVMTAVMGVVFTFVGILMTPAMLGFMKFDQASMADGKTYLTIYFAGILGLMIYNMGAGILRAVGDSKRPFYFLVVSAIINTVLDLLFVLGLGMGVEGVAYATVISQGISAVLVIVTLLRTDACIKLIPKRLRANFDILKKIIFIGLPAALQMAITSFSNVFVQSYINEFGPDYMSGWTAYSKIDQLALLPMQSLSLAATTFVAQNIGNDNEKRAKQGANCAVVASISIMIILLTPIIIFAPQLVAFFNKNANVVAYGTIMLRVQSPFYILCCINQIYAGALRGAGKSRVTMFMMLFSFVLFRQVYLYVMKNFISGELIPIILAYPAGWLVASALVLIYYNTTKLTKDRVSAD